jgi:iron complex transport system substrate-binding protein
MVRKGSVWLLFLSLHSAILPAFATQLQVTDDWQRKVILPAPAGRVIALSAHLTQLAIEAGLSKRLVATDLHSDLAGLAPADSKQIVRLAAYPQPSIEAIAQLKPDLVLLWGAGLKPSTVTSLERLGLVVFVSDPQRLGDIVSNLSRLGELAGNGGLASPENALAIRVNNLTARLQPRSYDRQVPVFLQVWQRPLLTLGRRSLIGNALEHCGAKILLAPDSHATAQINPEAVLTASIKAIVATDAKAARQFWDSRDSSAKSRQWSYVSLENSALSQPSPGLIDSLQVLCERLDSLR